VADKCVQGHRVSIFDRGATGRAGPLRDLSFVQWGRQRDSTSEATVRIVGDACDAQSDFLTSLSPHRHEVVIHRGNHRAWEGPIHRIQTQKGFAEIVAHDVSEYLFQQPMTQGYSNATVDGVSHSDTVTGRIEKIIQYEMSHGREQFAPNTPENAAEIPALIEQGYTFTPVGTEGWIVSIPAWEAHTPPANVLPYLNVHHWPNEARTTAVTEPLEMMVGDHLAGLARQSGIDWTTLGRSIHIWDVSRSLGRLNDMTEANFMDDVLVSMYGSDHAQSAYSIGQDGLYGSALALRGLAYYGPWTSLYTPYNEEGSEAPTQSELNSQARRNLSGRQPVPIEVRIPDNTSIIVTPDKKPGGIKVKDLVPGVQVLLRATLGHRKLNQMQKIDSMRVTETAQGENVQVTFTPATRADSDDVEEG